MIKEQIMQMAESDPRFAQAVDAMEAQVARMPIVPEDLDDMIKLLEFVLQNPDKYEEVRAGAIQDGDIDPQMVPEQFDQVFVVSMLVALYGLQDRLNQQGYARGGLATAARRLQSAGRGGDSQLAHINPREAEMLRRMGGAGTVNPNTGLQEYKSGKKLFSTLLPIALTFIAPGLGTAIGSALGASGIGASMLGGAIIGGASSAIGGGDWKKGALFGGIGGGLGDFAGGAANDALGLGLGKTGQAILGGTLVGGGAGLISGDGFAKGAMQGAIGSGVGQLAGGASGSSAFERGLSNAAKTFGNAYTAGYDPKTAATMGALSGIVTSLTKPSNAVLDSMKQTDPADGALSQTVTLPDGTTAPMPGSKGFNAQGQAGTHQLNPTTGKVTFVPKAGAYVFNPATKVVEWKVAEPSFLDTITEGGIFDSKSSATSTAGAKSDGPGMGTVVGGLTLLSALQSAPQEVQQAVQQMSPAQQEYFNRPSISWDWNKLQNDANNSNVSLTEYMARNWDKVSGGAYNNPQAPVVKARGGALSAVARFAQGAGSGRADTIDAKLSDGEYVIDAETVALIGDGSSKEGAKRLEQMRRGVRSHKGKTLAKGQISPNARSPLSYLKGVA